MPIKYCVHTDTQIYVPVCICTCTHMPNTHTTLESDVLILVLPCTRFFNSRQAIGPHWASVSPSVKMGLTVPPAVNGDTCQCCGQTWCLLYSCCWSLWWLSPGWGRVRGGDSLQGGALANQCKGRDAVRWSWVVGATCARLCGAWCLAAAGRPGEKGS
jgi:hypothetical protein